MRIVAASEFKEQCLELLIQLDADGLIITKDGKPIAKVVPFCPENEEESDDFQWADMIGSLRNKVTIKGDIFSTGIRWDAES